MGADISSAGGMIAHVERSWTEKPTSATKLAGLFISYIGQDLEEAKASCSGCPFLPGSTENLTARATAKARGETHPICHSHGGQVAVGFKASMKKHGGKRPALSLADVVGLIPRHVKAVRDAIIGDPAGACRESTLADDRTAERHGLSVIRYTHFAEGKGEWLKGRAMASCLGLEDAMRLAEAGWSVFAAVEWDWFKEGGYSKRLPNGMTAVICPNTASKWQGRRPVTCGDCGGKKGPLCTGKRTDGKGRPLIILNPDHGPGVSSRLFAAASRPGGDWALPGLNASRKSAALKLRAKRMGVTND